MRAITFAFILLLLAGAGYLFAHKRAQCMKVVHDIGAIFQPQTNNATSPTAAAPSVAVVKKTVTVAPKAWRPPAIIPSQPNWTWMTTDGKTYRNVRIIRIEPDNVTILDSEGGARIPIATLPSDIQKQLGYDPTLRGTKVPAQ